jgi:hypothetical protein
MIAPADAGSLQKFTPAGEDDATFRANGGQLRVLGMPIAGPGSPVIPLQLYSRDGSGILTAVGGCMSCVPTRLNAHSIFYNGKEILPVSTAFPTGSFRVVASGDVLNLTDGLLRRLLGAGGSAEIDVVEYYNSALDHYFMTGHPQEIDFVDQGNAGPGWRRTGVTFGAWNIESQVAGTAPACRFYGDLSAGPNSHFYSVLALECDLLKQLEAVTPKGQAAWRFERDAFRITSPMVASSAAVPDRVCPPALVPIYRVYSGRNGDPNHRYLTNVEDYKAMQAKGWVAEGVHMCAVPR